ncbi:MAG: RidA family protein [Candidatus Gracilibacteria bacterium]|nr:RidA family protein [Candidatus Gracilibacteria bacterium]
MKIINAEKAPKAIGPYSQAIIANNMLFASGQIALNPETMKITGENVKAQAKLVLQNIQAILNEAGLTKENIVKTTIFLNDMGDFAQVNEVYSEYFQDHKPARSTIEVARLPLDALVEIEIVCVIS